MAPDYHDPADDPHAALLHALAAAYHASQALLSAQEQYGRASAEAARAHEQLRQAQEDVIVRQRAYLTSHLPAPVRRRRSAPSATKTRPPQMATSAPDGDVQHGHM